MIRAFLAVQLSQALLGAIESFQQDLKRRLQNEGLKEARLSWVQPASIHLTMKFLGDIDAQWIVTLRDATAQAIETQAVGAMPIERLGAFPRPQGPRVLWVGPSQEWERGAEAQRLGAIQQSIEEACIGFGFIRETKPFNPHLTLARIKEGDRYVGNALARSGVMDRALALGSLAVGAIALMKSDLRPTGSVYTKLWEVKVGTG